MLKRGAGRGVDRLLVDRRDVRPAGVAVGPERRLDHESEAPGERREGERAAGNADRVRLESKAYREQVVSRATGEAQRFSQVLAEYEKAPEVTRERLYFDTIQAVLHSTTKIVLDSKAGNNITYLPLDKLLDPARHSAPKAAPVEGESTAVATPASDSPTAGGEAFGRTRDVRARGAR